MYQIEHGEIEVASDGKIHAKQNNKISVNNDVVPLLKKKSQEKIDNGGFNYW